MIGHTNLEPQLSKTVTFEENSILLPSRSELQKTKLCSIIIVIIWISSIKNVDIYFLSFYKKKSTYIIEFVF